MQTIFIKKCFIFYCGKCLSRKEIRNWVDKFSQRRSKAADDAQPDAKVAMGQVYRCWWTICREIFFFYIRISHVLCFISICDLFTDRLSYFTLVMDAVGSSETPANNLSDYAISPLWKPRTRHWYLYSPFPEFIVKVFLRYPMVVKQSFYDTEFRRNISLSFKFISRFLCILCGRMQQMLLTGARISFPRCHEFLRYDTVSRELTVGTATGLWFGRPGNRDSVPGKAKRLFTSLYHPDRLWGPPSLLYNGYWGLSPWR
jgi:hypothetical protein